MKKLLIGLGLFCTPLIALAGSQVFYTSGSFTVPGYGTSFTIQVIGGGGGGGGGGWNDTYSGGTGGSGSASWVSGSFGTVYGGGGGGGGGAPGQAASGGSGANAVYSLSPTAGETLGIAIGGGGGGGGGGGEYGPGPNGGSGWVGGPSGGGGGTGGGPGCAYRGNGCSSPANASSGGGGSAGGGGGGGSSDISGDGGNGGGGSVFYGGSGGTVPGWVPSPASGGASPGAGGGGGPYGGGGGGGGASGEVVLSWDEPSCSISLDTNPISYGSGTTLRWSSSGAQWFYINNVGYVNSSGSTFVQPSSDTDYSGTVGGHGTTATCAASSGTPQGTLNIITCTPSYTCSGNAIEYTDVHCQVSSPATCNSPYYCSPGSGNCLSSLPVFTSSGTLTGHLQLSQSLVQKGNSISVYWNVSNVTSCTVTGTNGDSWSGLSSGSSGQTSSPITVQTVYTLSCTGTHGASVNETQTVKLIPSVQEF